MSKAGSSSIQATLFNNAANLEKNGFRYLTEWSENHLISLKYLFSAYPVSPTSTGRLGRHSTHLKRQNKKNIATMKRIINTTECENLILSGEYFHDLWLDSTIHNIKEFIKVYSQGNDIETTIILVVRNPLTWLISSLQERIYKNGFMNKDCDFFEIIIQQYNGIANLQKHFSGSLNLLKFEDACLDKDGLVGCLLKTMDFPEKALEEIDIYKTNESRCLEVIEFIHYAEAVEPLHPYGNYRRYNPYRWRSDFSSLKDIRGAKFDLPYQSKAELWNRLQQSICLLKESTGIDYSNYEIPSPSIEETYTGETIQDFIKAFPKLSYVLQKHFLKFFEKKYMETSQEKFKQLHFNGSIPWKIFNEKNVFVSLLKLQIKYNYLKITREIKESIPRSVKTALKRIF